MIFQTLQIASKSLTAQQMGMDTISRNISNANTPGYSRQSTNLVSSPTTRIGQLQLGNGVEVVNVTRAASSGLRQSQVQVNSLDTFAKSLMDGLGALQGSFGNLNNTGLPAALNDFFTAQQQLANLPSDPAARSALVAKASLVATQSNEMQKQLVNAQQLANQQIGTLVSQANQLITQIAQINRQITQSTTRNPANNLLDQRDAAVMKLSALMPLQEINGANGGLMLQTPGGDLIVKDGFSRQLSVAPTTNSPFDQPIFTDNKQPLSGITKGGQIGALMTLRDQRISSYLGNLNSMNKNLIFSANQIQSNGTGTTTVSRYTSGLNAAAPAAPLNADASVPFAAKIVPGSFTIHVLNGNPPTNPAGTAINITATTTLNQVVTAINAVPGVTATLSAAGKLTIDGGVNRVAFSKDSSNFLAAYEVNTLFHGSSAATIAVDPAIAQDSGRLATATPDPLTSSIAVSDNSAALKMLALRDTSLSVDGTPPATLANRANTMIGQFGLDLASITQENSLRTTQAAALKKQQQAISGVNLDQEMVKMIAFQRSYQASAKMIQIADRMLNTLMGVIR